MLRLIRRANNPFQFIKTINQRPPLVRAQCRQYSEQAKPEKGTVSRRNTYVVTALVAAGLAGWAYYVKREKDIALLKYREKEVKKIEIGGRWELVDQLGNTRNSDELKGKWSIIYFGFTHCPDICPEEMDKMTAVAEGLEKANVPVQPIFITVDPERDSADVVKKYLHEFSDKILGLTGTVEQIEKVCKLFRVYFKVGPKDTDNDYIVDHTITLYLVDPNGHFIDYYGRSKTSEEIITSVHVNIGKWETLHKPKKWFWQS